MEQIMYLIAGLFGAGIAIGAFVALIQYIRENNKEEEHQCNCGHCHCHDKDGDRE